MKFSIEEKEKIIHALVIAVDYEADGILNNAELMEPREYAQEIDKYNKFVRLCEKFAKNWGYNFLRKPF